ncbi:MAG: GcrA family cell cycle regulator [Acetobacteraceae bacterium]
MNEAEHFDWTAAAIDRLRRLWADGHSTAEIGRRIGISKNAVVGKAHRLDFPARPSPIRTADPATSRPRPIPRPKAPKLADIMPLTTATTPLSAPLPLQPSRPAAPGAAQAVPLRGAAQKQSMRTNPCCWPIGEPGTRGFRFCDATAPLGKPYCAEHAKLAYAKVRNHRESEANAALDWTMRQ